MIGILLDNFVNDKRLLVKLPIIPRKGDWIHLEYNEEFTEGESYLNVRKVILTMVLCEGQGLEIQIFNKPLKMIRNTNVDDTTNALPFAKHVLPAGVFRVLIGCEESQTVCKLFRDLGIEAYSCDLKECSGGLPEYHLQMDIFKAIDLMDWDFIGLHPVCTKMTLSGNRHYAPGKENHCERLEAVEWTIKLWEYACKKAKYIYMENPMGAMNGDKRLPKPQIIQPYYFGDEFQKTTCLWLQNLKPLYHNKEPNLFDSKVTHVGKGEMWTAKSGKVIPKWFAESASTNNEANRTLRSKTFPGIAKAMSEQWGLYACR